MLSQISSTFLVASLLLLVATNVARSQRSPGKKGRTTPIPVTPSTTPLAEIDLTDPEHFRDDGAKCVEIPSNMTLCKGIGYTQMRLPNLFHQQTLTEATREASTWTPLLASHCHPDAQLFLCSLFSPVCLDQPIWPCKSLCEQVKRGCEPRLAAFGFPWPNMLNCDKFPSNYDLCIDLQHNKKSNSTQAKPVTAAAAQLACNACRTTESTDELRSNYCAADFVAKISPEESELMDGELKIKAAKKVKYYKRPNSIKMRKSKPTFHLESFSDCDCYDLANITQNGAKVPYFVMGKIDATSKKMTLTNVQKLDKQAAAIKRSMRIFTKGKSCNNLTASTVSAVTEKPEFTTEKSKAECQAERKRNKNKLKKKNRDQKYKHNQEAEIEEDVVIEAESGQMKKNKKERVPKVQNGEIKNKQKNEEVRQQERANKKAQKDQ